jgi:hypothetical protein
LLQSPEPAAAGAEDHHEGEAEEGGDDDEDGGVVDTKDTVVSQFELAEYVSNVTDASVRH